MRKYTEAQKEAGKKVWAEIAPELQPIVDLDREKESLPYIADIMMRLVTNQPVTKSLTHYFHRCAGIGNSSYEKYPTPYSEELSHLIGQCIDRIGTITGNHVDSEVWLGTWPLVAFPVHKSGTQPKTGIAKQED